MEPRPLRSSKVTGNIGEEMAVRYLRAKGFSILDRNFREPWGEIDIVAVKNSIVHFVEVKSTARNISREKDAWDPAEMANATKLAKVARTAQLYMESRRDTREFQVDVIAVYLDMQSKRARCVLYEQVL